MDKSRGGIATPSRIANTAASASLHRLRHEAPQSLAVRYRKDRWDPLAAARDRGAMPDTRRRAAAKRERKTGWLPNPSAPPADSLANIPAGSLPARRGSQVARAQIRQ